MEIFHGQSIRPGVAIAAAARLNTEFGVPSFSPERLRRLGERLRRFGVDVPEIEQVILIAETVPKGFLLAPVPGIEIVGVAVQTSQIPAPSPEIPAVIGLGTGLTDSILEDEIVIVDGDRGRVYVGPDANTVARYQSPVTRSRRFFIDSAHMPARTATDYRLVKVLAPARMLSEVTVAMDAGADGLYIPADNDFLGGEDVIQTSGEQLTVLTDVFHLIAGQPLFLHIPPERLALSSLSRAASAGPVHLILDDLSDIESYRTRLSELEEIFEEDDTLFGTVRFDVGWQPEDAVAPPLDGLAGVVLHGPASQFPFDRLRQFMGQVQEQSLTSTLILDNQYWSEAVHEAMGMGFTQLVVPAELVEDIKDVIREA